MKTIFFAVCYFFFLIESAAAQNAVPSPTAEWPLTQASISGTTVADASGNSNAGTIVNGPLTFGDLGANFNGQQYVDSPLTAAWPALTVSAWFNVAKFNNNPRLVANSYTNVDKKGFQLALNGDNSGGWFDVGNGSSDGMLDWSKQISSGTTYHYVGVYDGATITAYINGTQVASKAFAGGAVAAGSGPHINVARSPSGAFSFTGTLYDVRIYKAALTAAQVAALYQSRQACPAGQFMVSSSPFTCVPVQGMCGTTAPVTGATCNAGDSCFTIDRSTKLPVVSIAVCDGTWVVSHPVIGETK